MFRIGFLLLLATAAVWYFQIRICNEDRTAYAQLVQESANLRSKSTLELSPIRQFRKGVKKDLWTFKNNQWRKASLESASSDLILTQKKQKIEAMELLENIAGYAPEGTFSAELGTLDLRSSHLALQGTVKLAWQINAIDSFALADRATFRAKNKTLILESDPSHRVLFWQDGLEMSAPTVHIRNAAQGIGDVRLAFNSKEKQLIDRFWKEAQ